MSETLKSFEGKEFRVLKEVLAEILIEKIFPIGHEVRKMLNEENYLKGVLEEGAQKAKEQADKDDENPNTYYKFLDLFYKNNKEIDDEEKTD